MIVLMLQSVATLNTLCLLTMLAGGIQTSRADEANIAAKSVEVIVDRATHEFFAQNPQAVGLSIGTIRDGKVYTHNSGARPPGVRNRPEANSLYPIASISKTFTGMLLAQASVEGKLKLTDDIRKYLNDRYPNLEYQGHFIQVGQLVSHLSGLPFNLPDIPENRPPFRAPIPLDVERMLDLYSRDDFLTDLHKVKLDRVPGERFSYSNSAAVLASLILERLYGESYENIVAQKIGSRLKMADTTISLNPSQMNRLMKGYDAQGKLTKYPRDIALGAGALKSTVNDLLKYAEWQMDEQDEAVKLAHVPTFTYNNYSVGLNWQMIKSGNSRRIWQEGDTPGFVSICMFFPEYKLALVALANEEDPASSHALSVMISDVAKQLDPRTAPLF
jgi:D-alanyl-D-alanine-carboxypeptidase/D-alanyl-D-alanine-endopeptidase